MHATSYYAMLRHFLRLAAAVYIGSTGVVVFAAPPALPPVNFHPFGPATPLIPDGSVVPLRPVRPVKTMSPMFQLPVSPFGNLGQNWGALGGVLMIEQKQAAPHRRPIELVPSKGKAGAAGSASPSKGGRAATTAGTPSPGSGKTPSYRRSLGW